MAKKEKLEKPPYSGYFLTFELGRLRKIRECLHYPGEASESFSAMDWVFERREVAFLSFTPERASVDAVVLMDRMHGSGGTGKLKMRMWAPIIFKKPIVASELASAFPSAERLCTAETFRRIPPAEWLSVIDAVKALRPEEAAALDQLLILREAKNPLVGLDRKALRLSEQRDAVGLALDIASLDRQTILREAKFDGYVSAKSVLDLLDSQSVHEQDLIRKDEAAFLSLLSTSELRSARFDGSAGREVRVYVADKKPLETVLGIDLLIFLADFNSYLLLQYKAMHPKSDEEGKAWSYLVDEQLRKQVLAMDKAVAAIEKLPASNASGLMSWRLSAEAFFFKFCEATKPDARGDALVAGITLGHSHVKRFLDLPESHGKDGGQRIGYLNCPRYFNNTQFIDLAREGWIGTGEQGFQFISSVIRAGQEGGRSAMYAVIEGTGAKTAAERKRRVR